MGRKCWLALAWQKARQDQLPSTHLAMWTSLQYRLWKSKITSDCTKGRSSGSICPLNHTADCGGDVNVAQVSPQGDTHAHLPWTPGEVAYCPLELWNNSPSVSFMGYFCGVFFAKVSICGALIHILFLHTMDISLLVPCSFSSFIFFSFSLLAVFSSWWLLWFSYLPPPFPSSLFYSVLTLSLHYISYSPVALVPVGEESISFVNASRKRSPPQQRDTRESSFCLRLIFWFLVCLWFFFEVLDGFFVAEMLHQTARFTATMGAKSESGWLSGSHCRVLCSWSSISVMCGWMDLNNPTVVSFAPHAFLCLNSPPKSHWRPPSPSGIEREATKLLPIIGLVAGASLVMVKVHSLGLGRCKIETTGCSSYLFAGQRAVCLCLSQNLLLGLCWFRFHQCILLPHRPGTSKGWVCSTRSQSTHTVNHQGCNGLTFLLPILQRGRRVKLSGVAVHGLWAFTLWAAFAHYRPYPVSVLPKHCLLSVLVTSRVGTYAYVSKYCLTIIV